MPNDTAFALVGMFNGCIEYGFGRGPDVRPDAVSFNERNDRTVRNDGPAISVPINDFPSYINPFHFLPKNIF
jgi:hypothetical protein